MTNIVQQVKLFFTTRKRAYQFTFDDKNVYAQMVLTDLAKFCRAHHSTFNADARAHAVAEGRREVWLRIQNYLNLTPDELWELYRRQGVDNE